jgi:hypothetical protein
MTGTPRGASVLMFVRYGEKLPTDQGPPRGVSADGEQDPRVVDRDGLDQGGGVGRVVRSMRGRGQPGRVAARTHPSGRGARRRRTGQQQSPARRDRRPAGRSARRAPEPAVRGRAGGRTRRMADRPGRPQRADAHRLRTPAHTGDPHRTGADNPARPPGDWPGDRVDNRLRPHRHRRRHRLDLRPGPPDAPGR